MLRKCVLLLCALALFSAVAPASATSQDTNWNQRTYFTFSAPVELPGKTLPAGTYVFRLLDSPSSRHIVQVFDRDEKEIQATLLAIPAQRVAPADEPEVRFMETGANQPAAIRTWWFPGRTIGHEFIYPREQATRIAKASRESVLTVSNEANTADAMRDAELARVNESAQTTTVSGEQTPTEVTGTAVRGRAEAQAETAQRTETPSTTDPPPPTTQAAPSTPPPAASERTTVPQPEAVTQRPVTPATDAPAQTTEPVQTTRTELPRTATALPLAALLGLAALAGAAAMRLRRRR